MGKYNKDESGNKRRVASTRKYELQFVVMINPGTPSFPLTRRPQELTRQLHEDFADAKHKSDASLDPSGNLVELRDNDQFEPSLASDPTEGYLYFPYSLEVSPTSNVSLEHQVAFAKALKANMEAHGHQAVICADFEELLEEP